MSKLTMLYDQHCVLCTNSVRTLRKLKTTAELIMIPLQQADLGKLLPGRTLAELEAQVHVLDDQGQVYEGADAINQILKTVKGLKWISSLYHIPGLRPLADLIYKWVAKHRYQLFGKIDSCESGTCELHYGRNSNKE